MQQQIEQLAARLHGLGVRRADRVAFLGLNQPMFLFALFASTRLGAIFVPLNVRLAGPEMAANLDDADVSVLIADAEHRILVDGDARRSAVCAPFPQRRRSRRLAAR